MPEVTPGNGVTSDSLKIPIPILRANFYELQIQQDRKLSDTRRDTWAHTSPRATVAHSLRSTSSIEW